MDKLEQKIKGAKDAEFPRGLHGKIVRSVMVRHYRWHLAAVFAIVVFNALISGWRLNTGFHENGTIQAFSSFFGSFSADYDFVSDFLSIVRDFVPMQLSAIFLANFILSVYVAKLYFDILKYDGYERSNRI